MVEVLLVVKFLVPRGNYAATLRQIHIQYCTYMYVSRLKMVLDLYGKFT
jgi:hypothetical protein